ncbi:TetR family transcriptional regulator [Streptomyces sp. NPDC091212]|uniref:TetR/AcrR family transcriptional regulator n=1 Tax=Streptomyces sp. NPDC091212 TaxID=3155191 RepID=UPI003444CC9C
MAGGTVRAEQVSATRELILTAAERLFAERGVYAVSNRQVSEAAGQGNNAAVGYHFGTKADLVRAIARKHAEQIEQARERRLAEAGDSTDVRVWVSCLVHPITDHLEALGSPTWYGRFCAQAMTDPALRDSMVEESLTSPALQRIVDGFNRALPELPAEAHAERGMMSRQLILHMCAEREAALADGTGTVRPSWRQAADGLVDALVGLWLAPITGGAAAGARPRS